MVDLEYSPESRRHFERLISISSLSEVIDAVTASDAPITLAVVVNASARLDVAAAAIYDGSESVSSLVRKGAATLQLLPELQKLDRRNCRAWKSAVVPPTLLLQEAEH